MLKKEALEILKQTPFKFRTKQGNVITVREILEENDSTFSFKDRQHKKAFLCYSDLNPPFEKLEEEVF